jgi:hypothetical protein
MVFDCISSRLEKAKAYEVNTGDYVLTIASTIKFCNILVEKVLKKNHKLMKPTIRSFFIPYAINYLDSELIYMESLYQAELNRWDKAVRNS